MVCGCEFEGMGYDPWPLQEDGYCCKECGDKARKAGAALMEQKEKEFETYFQENGFKDFEKFIGWTVPEFETAYGEFKTYIEGFYQGHCASHNYKYKDNEVRYPLMADICSYGGVEFYVDMGKDHRVKRAPTVSVLKDNYYITFPPSKVEFFECEEVMKDLLWVYYMNKDYYDEYWVEVEKYKNMQKTEKPCSCPAEVDFGLFG